MDNIVNVNNKPVVVEETIKADNTARMEAYKNSLQK